MVKGFELIRLISLIIGAIADVSFFILFYFIPLVKHGPGLKFIAIAVGFNLFNNIAAIIFIILYSYNVRIEIAFYIIGNYCYTSYSNWILFYNYYIYQLICKNTQITSEFLFRFIKCEILFTLILVLVMLLMHIIGNRSALVIIIVFYLCFYFVFDIYSLRISQLIYLELKKKYFELKRRAIIDFARLVSFPFTRIIIHSCVILLTFYNPNDMHTLSPCILIIGINGVFILICLLLTQEMKDGIKLLKRKARLINCEIINSMLN